jgi:hypothetical protein
MTTFNTITEKEILKHAYNSLLELWHRECDLCETAKRNGETDERALMWAQKYGDQLNEISNRIKELESGAA